MATKGKVGNPAPNGNLYHLTHGGERAYVALSQGKAFKGLAAQLERDTKAEFDASGRLPLLTTLAIRAHTVAMVYWHAVCTAVDERDMDKLDTYVKRFGWFVGVTGRAWREVREEERLHTGDVSYDELVQRLVDGEKAAPMPEVNDANAQNDDGDA